MQNGLYLTCINGKITRDIDFISFHYLLCLYNGESYVLAIGDIVSAGISYCLSKMCKLTQIQLFLMHVTMYITCTMYIICVHVTHICYACVISIITLGSGCACLYIICICWVFFLFHNFYVHIKSILIFSKIDVVGSLINKMIHKDDVEVLKLQFNRHSNFHYTTQSCEEDNKAYIPGMQGQHKA